MTQEELSSIPEQIHAEAVRRVEQETERARRVAERHVSSAKIKVEEMEQELQRELGLLLKRELDRKVAKARIEARNKKLAFREALCEEILTLADSRLAELPRDQIYLKILERLVLEAAEELGLPEAKLMLNSKDASFLAEEGRMSELENFLKKNLAAEVRLEVSAEPIECAGGVVAASQDGRVYYYNTFEEIMSRRKHELMRQVERQVIQEDA